jgi:WD40 repeat protein/serine/threonine protein kinase
MTGESLSQDQAVESLLGRIAGEFTDRLQRGENPSIEEYAGQYPQIAELLRQVLPSLQVIDSVSPSDPVQANGSVPGCLGDFRIIREVGRGGMGVVYQAEQVSLNRRVALKVLPFAATMDPRQLQRFQNEARAAASLEHPHIVPVHGVGCERGVHFYAMKFIEGRTLAELIAELPRTSGPPPSGNGHGENLPAPNVLSLEGRSSNSTAPIAGLPTGSATKDPVYFRRVAELGVEAAKALEYAHSMGIVHRDVKPGNLMLDGGGKLWVTDFGLARTASDSSLTMTGDVLGTLRYMSPEQALAKHGLVDHRTDVYSLGVTLYELLTGTPAVNGKDREEILNAITLDEPRPPRRLDSAIPHDLETIVLKAMEKNPAERYTTAQELADDLGCFLTDRSIRARRPALVQRIRKWGRRHTGVVRAAVVVLVLATVGSIAAASVIWQQQQKTEEALDDRTKALHAEKAALAKEKKALAEKDLAFKREQGALARARIILANREQLAGNYGETQKLLDLCPSELRQWEWHYLAWACQRARQPAPLTLHPGDKVECLAYSPDGQRLATACGKDTVKVWDVRSGKVLFSLPRQANVVCVGFSRDGRQLAAGMSDATVSVWDIETKHKHTLEGHKATVRKVAFSTDGQRLVSGSEDGTAKVWDVQAGLVLSSTPKQPGPIFGVTFSPDRTRIATGGRNKRVQVWTASNGKEILSLQGHTNDVNHVAFSPDGKRLASAGWDGTVKVWDADTGDALLTLFGHTGPVEQLVFLPGGARLASVSSRQGTMNLWGMPKGRSVRSYSFNLNGWQSRTAAISPEGRWLAVGSGDAVRILDTMSSPAGLSIDAGASVILALAFSPDGRQVAAASVDVKLCDAATGQEIRTFAHKNAMVNGVAFSPNGSLLASASADKTIKVWDVAGGREVHSLNGHTSDVWTVVFSPDGSLLASTSDDGTVRLWAAATGKFLHTLEGHVGYHCGVAFSPDGRSLASVTPDGKHRYRVRVWDVATAKETDLALPSQPAPISTPVFSSDGGRIIAQVEGQGTKVWDATTGQELLSPPLFGKVLTALSPDGQRLAAPGRDHTVQLWDATTGELILTLRGHADPIRAIAISPDGRRLASGDFGGTVRIWDATPLAEK